MITAELMHNPYLLETTVRFNGQQPRVNCQIEKYDKQPLQQWVDKVPEIFYNEMNGYDFEFQFVGTEPDFEAVKNSFRKAGVQPGEVLFFHKNNIEDVGQKSEEILHLLGWLADNHNRRFDYGQFYKKYSRFFEDAYPLILFNGKNFEIPGIPISVDEIEDVNELQNTDLTSTPAVICIDTPNTGFYRQQIDYLRTRKDVNNNQLFFFIAHSLTALQRERIIAELSIDRPQIISSFQDGALKKYLDDYPIAEFIRESIMIFNSIADSIAEEVEEENKKSVIINAEVHDKLQILDSEIASIKAAEDFFRDIDNLSMPESVISESINLTESIQKWRNKKTKVVGEYEINNAAGEFESDIRGFFEHFLYTVKEASLKKAVQIYEQFQSEFHKIEISDNFIPQLEPQMAQIPIFPELKTKLIHLKQESFVEKNKDFLGALFKRNDTETPELVRIVTCYFDQWRNQANQMLMPLANSFLEECEVKLNEYYHGLADAYIARLHDLHREETEKREHVSAQLSDDERLLQMDNDWLAELKDQLEQISRG